MQKSKEQLEEELLKSKSKQSKYRDDIHQLQDLLSDVGSTALYIRELMKKEDNLPRGFKEKLTTQVKLIESATS